MKNSMLTRSICGAFLALCISFLAASIASAQEPRGDSRDRGDSKARDSRDDRARPDNREGRPSWGSSMRERWNNMSEEERAALRKRLEGMREAWENRRSGGDRGRPDGDRDRRGGGAAL